MLVKLETLALLKYPSFVECYFNNTLHVLTLYIHMSNIVLYDDINVGPMQSLISSCPGTNPDQCDT